MSFLGFRYIRTMCDWLEEWSETKDFKPLKCVSRILKFLTLIYTIYYKEGRPFRIFMVRGYSGSLMGQPGTKEILHMSVLAGR